MKLICTIIYLALSQSVISSSQELEPSQRCDSIPGSDRVIRSGAVLMLGELHGTNEAPETLTNLVCAALNKKLAVTVALEIWESDQELISEYINSAGSDSDRAKLLTGDFWNYNSQDGRTSEAMVAALESLRQYRSKVGERVNVIVIDDRSDPKGRDHHMASRLQEQLRESPERFLISLTGNWHSQLVLGSSFDAEFESMGYLLKEWNPEADITAIDMIHNGGTAWVCLGGGECGPIQSPSIADGFGIELFPPDANEEYSGYYFVGQISASPPAIQ